MIQIDDFISGFSARFSQNLPWKITSYLQSIVIELIKGLGENYDINNEIAIHKSARIEEGVVLKGPVFIGKDCFVAAHAYIRSGVYLGESTVIGPGCEIKSSIIFGNSSIAHFNFVGDSIIGSHVNMEAGAVIANHYNERTNKEISVVFQNKSIHTGTEKFGALIGDGCKIGANAVLSPGTILGKDEIIRRLQLVEQLKIV